MHHFLYPTQDTYISNKSTLIDKNFGIDEILSIGVKHNYSKVLNNTKTYPYSNYYVVGLPLTNFTGIFTGSFYGNVSDSNGTIVNDSTRFSASYFSGSVSGSINGFEAGSPIINSNYNGNLFSYSGSIESYTINGNVSGSIITNCFSSFTGNVTSLTGSVTGYLNGNDIKNELNTTTVDQQYIDRILIKFDLTTISESISNGVILSPNFYLKLKSSQATELPTTYTIHAFPVSKTWNQGNGYWSDGGSDDGANWKYSDNNYGDYWFDPYVDTRMTASVDYINDYNYVSESFKRGGGTWHNIHCTQSFSYESSDININVTSIVYSWMTQTIPNEGIILMYSGEVNLTSSNASMYFFSKETNTIFSPRLDVVWDDSSWSTGSISIDSITVESHNSGITGSMVNPIVITNQVITGSVNGNAFILTDVNGIIDNKSVVSLNGTSNTINGVFVSGHVTGSSITNTDGSQTITATITNGNFISSSLSGQYSSSMFTGVISGSISDQLLLNHNISGNFIDGYQINAFQYSPLSGSLIGTVTSTTFDGGIIDGVFTSGNLVGATVSIPFTGSYSCLTSSYSFTSSVNYTSSVLSALDTSRPFVVVIQNLKKEYSFGDIPRITVFGREQYPLKTFERSLQQASYVTPKYLPENSYYAIKDNETEEIIIDFDSYTRLSCDQVGNYFYLDTTGLTQERYYKVLIRVVDSSENIYTFDSTDLFKIRR